EGGLALLRSLGVERVHVHNLGYYVLVLKKPYPVAPDWVRAACLFASAVNARKAQRGGFVPRAELGNVADLPFAESGFEQLAGFARELAERRPAGIDAAQVAA